MFIAINRVLEWAKFHCFEMLALSINDCDNYRMNVKSIRQFLAVG